MSMAKANYVDRLVTAAGVALRAVGLSVINGFTSLLNGTQMGVIRSDDWPAIEVDCNSDTLTHYPAFQAVKSRNDALGTKAETADTDWLGAVEFYGIDNTSAVDFGARIYAKQNGVAGTKVPCDIVIQASTNAATTERMRLLTDGTIRMGLTPNYTEFESTGFKKMVGTARVYDDLILPISSSKPGATAPNWENLIGNIEAYTFAKGDYVFGSTEITHDWEEGSTLEAHLHWITNGSEGSDKKVAFALEYTWANFPTAAPFGVLAAADTLTMADTTITAGTTDRTCRVTTLGNIALGTGKIGAVLMYRLIRNNLAGAGSDPVADPFVVSLGIHFIADTGGSRSQYTKT